MKELRFSFNWNGKLDCKAFITIRLSGRFEINDRVKIIFKEKEFEAIVLDKKVMKMNKINEWVAYLDTGYDGAECRKILERMYKNKGINWETQPIYYYLLRREK